MIERLPIKFTADPKKVILQPLFLYEGRLKKVIQRVNSLSESKVKDILNDIFKNFSYRHKNFEELILKNYLAAESYIDNPQKLSEKRKLLIGAYLSKEYSIEAASLFNPSIVEHPDQSGITKGSKRVIMSLRATGEGHISSIEFRELIFDKSINIKLKNVSRFSVLPEIKKYSLTDIKKRKSKYLKNFKDEDLVDSNYGCSFTQDTLVSERVIFPHSKSEMGGMEDVRFVRFVDNNDVTYYGTYTAYNGKTFRTQLISTKDFFNFEVETMHGPAIMDKGLALFPEKIDNKYVMIGRIDGENLYVMHSDDLYNWKQTKIIWQPKAHWEFIQIGNCGSPIKTKSGWILITHAVGPFRRYIISALLLDLNDPSKIIGTLPKPLIEPNKKEREGYVPNVVYSCGSMEHTGYLVIPYAMSDAYCGFAKVKVNTLLKKFK